MDHSSLEFYLYTEIPVKYQWENDRDWYSQMLALAFSVAGDEGDPAAGSSFEYLDIGYCSESFQNRSSSRWFRVGI